MKSTANFLFLFLSFIFVSLSADALEENCKKTQVNIGDAQGDYKLECDTVIELPPDDVINGRPAGTGGGGGGTTGGNSGVDIAAETAANTARKTKELCKSRNPEYSKLATITSRADSTDRTAAANAILREDPVLQKAARSSAYRGVQLTFTVTFSDGGTQSFTVVIGSTLTVQESDKGALVLGDGVVTGCPA